MVHSPHPQPLQDLQQLEGIGAITGSSRIQIAQEHEREWTDLVQMERGTQTRGLGGATVSMFFAKRDQGIAATAAQ